ncbi:pfkB carbohydrate kinase family protein [Listeria floridensis FSL S10-1187]|uniref:PfkB carbohydrate kinase family protein n=1 Tax=Listeria floridensis FSL S10-1187 TaxID=1265817 RepID=A0ABN0RHL4_9LIST|nr:sugar kinase [Listeria floridensis]EUJ33417.1 pfkB carbohydrate kinase family protein [Listeria floridensis FSL S10-1187]
MKVLSYGEVNLRFTPPDYQLLEQTNQLTYQVTGTGVNLLTNLRNFGMQVSLLTTLPDNNIGKTAAAHIRKYGINDDFVSFNGNHIGSYFVELGYGARPTMVTYQNRLASAFCQAEPASYNIEAAVCTSDIIHICGITLLLNEKTRETALKLASCANQMGKPLYFDFNYRPSLNTEHSKAFVKEQYEKILFLADTVFGGILDITELLEIPVDKNRPISEQLQTGIAAFKAKYPVRNYVGTIRGSAVGEHSLSGFIAGEGFKVSREMQVEMLDRIGAGDAYAAGIIYGLSEGWSEERTLDFAVSNAVLAHTITGDVPHTNRKDVEALMNGKQQSLVR